MFWVGLQGPNCRFPTWNSPLAFWYAQRHLWSDAESQITDMSMWSNDWCRIGGERGWIGKRSPPPPSIEMLTRQNRCSSELCDEKVSDAQKILKAAWEMKTKTEKGSKTTLWACSTQSHSKIDNLIFVSSYWISEKSVKLYKSNSKSIRS